MSAKRYSIASAPPLIDLRRLHTPFDRVVALAALLLPTAYGDLFFVPSWTPRMAILILLLPLGVLELVRALRARDIASWAVIAFVGALALATVIADAPLWNLRGGVARDSGLVFIGGAFAVWAVARGTSRSARRQIAVISIAGVLISSAVGLAQVFLEPDGFWMMIGSRPSGLMVNPVYFGAICAGACATLIHFYSPHRHPTWVAAGIVVLAASVNLSGSRGAILGLAVATLPLIGRHRMSGRATVPLLAILGGLAVGGVLSRVTGGRGVADRLERGADGRGDIWRYALEAFTDRPVTGHGLGQFRAAVQTHFEPDFVRESAFDVAGAAWPDAHNIVLQYAVVGGVFALIPAVIFVVAVVRISRGPLLWAVVAVSVTWMLQPATLVTVPIVMLWLGLAATPVPDDRPPLETERVKLLLVAVGALLALTLVGLDNRLRDASRSSSADRFEQWASIAPDDPVLASSTSGLAARLGQRDRATTWARKAVELEPWDSVTRAQYAIRLFDSGDTGRALDEAKRAIEIDEWNSFALNVAIVIGNELGDEALAAEGRSRLCQIAPDGC